MGLYIYCILPAGCAPDSCAGIDGAPVNALDHAGLTAWTSALDLRPEPTLERVRAHNAVVQHAVDTSVTPVPVRFGQWLAGAHQLHEHLDGHRDHYHGLLTLVQGALEFGLRFLDPRRTHQSAPPVTQAASGKAYLEALRRQLLAPDPDDAETESLRTALHDVFQNVTRDVRIEPLRTEHGLLSVAHLVRRVDFAAYHSSVQMMRQRFPHLRLLASGPWPPYSFAV